MQQRTRDEKGRFASTKQSDSPTAEEFESRWGKIEITKVKDTYASYVVRQRLFTEIERDIVVIVGITLVAAIFI
ncbi:hypothetical protein [Bacillus sp. UMB0893]|uniref:hypothetical protein n=1 Tax=Bacillus sp. UMB0893 TaxID=2066053 RepID=UPI000C759855|nr:hypothetical protein [Bacillus sp. UMB0893]PLR65988.1 hypothetical protein CYJ36_20150 [Bacillus sp. UMB0893]